MGAPIAQDARVQGAGRRHAASLPISGLIRVCVVNPAQNRRGRGDTRAHPALIIVYRRFSRSAGFHIVNTTRNR